MNGEKENNMIMPFCCRVQKITEALYRVTDLMPDKEPLRWQLRLDAVELFDFLIQKEQKEIFEAKNIFSLVKRLARTLQLACASSAYVSSINFEVLRREYLSLSDSLESQIESERNKLQSGEQVLENILPAEPFSLPEYNGQLLSDKVLSLSKDKFSANGHPFRQSADDGYVLNNHNGQRPELVEGQTDKKNIPEEPEEKEAINKTDNVQTNNHEDINGQKKEVPEIVLTPLETRIGNAAGAKSALFLTGLKERKRKILSLIKGDDWLSTREISDSLPEFGDKSIQRDLLEMVSVGVLKKTGDKRWRKYALV